MPKINVPFTVTTNNRTFLNTKDALSQNVFIEQGDKNYVVKRPGAYLIKSYTALTAGDAVTYPAGVARGWIYSHAHNKYYTLIGSKLWAISADLSTFTAVTMAVAPTSATSPVYFTETEYGATTSVILHQPGATGQLWTIALATPSVATLVTDVDWIATTTVGAPVSLDTTLYTMSNSASTCTIQGSDLSNPTSYAALNVINAYQYHDFGITLAKSRNILVCFKDRSTEFFYDAANTVGSPLSRITEASIQIGCASAPSVVNIDESIIWMSQDQNGGLGFYKMDGTTAQKISTTFIDRTLSSVEAIVNTGVVQATYLSFEGHKFYICSIDGQDPGNQAIPGSATPGVAIPGTTSGGSTLLFTRTLVYDLTTSQWFEWTSTDALGYQASYFAAFCITGSSVSNTKSYSNALILDKANGNVYELSPPPLASVNPTSYKDIRPIQVKIVTNKLDGGTRNRKKISLLEVKGDTDTETNSLSVRYSDDDYKTWSAARSVDLLQRPFLTNLGMFRNRAFEFTHVAERPLRLTEFELNVEVMDH